MIGFSSILFFLLFDDICIYQNLPSISLHKWNTALCAHASGELHEYSYWLVKRREILFFKLHGCCFSCLLLVSSFILITFMMHTCLYISVSVNIHQRNAYDYFFRGENACDYWKRSVPEFLFEDLVPISYILAHVPSRQLLSLTWLVLQGFKTEGKFNISKIMNNDS